jgi:hypothetical protein
MAVLKRLLDVVTLSSSKPVKRLVAYYAILLVVVATLLWAYPGTNALLTGGDAATTTATSQILQDGLNPAPLREVFFGQGSLGALVVSTSLILLGILALMLPVTWVYMWAKNTPGHNQDVVHTLLILPIVVAGIVSIVQNSLALAFSLAGVVAAVRFRTTLDTTRDIVFIFLAIVIGFAGGVQMLGLGAMFSVAFNFVVLLTWRYDFGRTALVPTAASQWSEPLGKLAKTNGDAVPDRDVLLALSPKKLEALGERFDRVRAVTGPKKKKPRYNAILSVTSDKVDEAQAMLPKVLDKLTKRWMLDEVVIHTGKPSEVYYLVRVGKSTNGADIASAIRDRAGDRISAVDLELGDKAAKAAQNGSQ